MLRKLNDKQPITPMESHVFEKCDPNKPQTKKGKRMNVANYYLLLKHRFGIH